MHYEKSVITVKGNIPPTEKELDNIRSIMKSLYDWKEVRNKIYPIILPKNISEKDIDSLVWFPKLDFLVGFVVRCFDTKGNVGSIKVKEEMLSIWNVSAEKLYFYAFKNMKSDDYKLQNSIDLLFGDTLFEDVDLEEELPKLYMLTNKYKCYGAAGIISDDLLYELLDTDCFIFPSSIDEVFVLPASEMYWNRLDDMFNMVKDINKKFVPADSVLSDSVYFYDSKRGKLNIAKRKVC